MQSLHQAGLHGVGVHLPHLHAAGGDDGLLHRALAADGHRERLGQLQQRVPLLPGHGIDLLRLFDSGAPEHHRNQRPGIEIHQRVVGVLVLIFLEVPQHAAVQRALVQRGLQIDVQGVAVRLLHVGAG